MAASLTDSRTAALRKAFLLLSGGKETLSGSDLANAVRAVTDRAVEADELATLTTLATGDADKYNEFKYGSKYEDEKTVEDPGVSLDGFTQLLRTGSMQPLHKGRYFVALSLAEAETLRRVLHVRGSTTFTAPRLLTCMALGPAHSLLHFLSRQSPPGHQGSSERPGRLVSGEKRGWRVGICTERAFTLACRVRWRAGRVCRVPAGSNHGMR